MFGAFHGAFQMSTATVKWGHLSHCISGHSVCVEKLDQLCSQMHLILDSSHSIAWPWNMYVLSRLQALSRHT